jgi:hypothetical protein
MVVNSTPRDSTHLGHDQQLVCHTGGSTMRRNYLNDLSNTPVQIEHRSSSFAHVKRLGIGKV